MLRGTPYMAATAFAGTPLDSECHAGSAANSDIDAVGGQKLLQLGIACRGRRLDLEAVLGEDAGLHADIERRKRPGERHHLGDAQLFGGTRGRNQDRERCTHSQTA